MSEPKGFSLSVLRESLLKAKGDSSASRSRIRRLKSELIEVDSRIKDQIRQNGTLKGEVNEMKSRSENLTSDIKNKNSTLDNFMTSNCEFVKQKVVEPAEQGIAFAKDTIDCFNEIIASSYKLNMLFKRQNPEVSEAATQIDLAFPTYNPKDEESKTLEAEVLRLELELFKKQEMSREAKSIARGNRSNKGYFANISRTEWESKVDVISKLLQEESDLEAELLKLEEELARPDDVEMSAAEGNGIPVAEVVQGFEPMAPAAVQVGSFVPYTNNYSNDYWSEPAEVLEVPAQNHHPPTHNPH